MSRALFKTVARWNVTYILMPMCESEMKILINETVVLLNSGILVFLVVLEFCPRHCNRQLRIGNLNNVLTSVLIGGRGVQNCDQNW